MQMIQISHQTVTPTADVELPRVELVRHEVIQRLRSIMSCRTDKMSSARHVELARPTLLHEINASIILTRRKLKRSEINANER